MSFQIKTDRHTPSIKDYHLTTVGPHNQTFTYLTSKLVSLLYSRSRYQGYTVFELVITLALIGLILAGLTPKLSQLLNSMDRNKAIQQVEFDLRRARIEAVSQGVRSIVNIQSDGKAYTVGLDYVPFSSTNTADSTLLTAKLPNKITISCSEPLIFNSRGFLVNTEGNPVSRTIAIKSNDVPFGAATISPSGAYEFNFSS